MASQLTMAGQLINTHVYWSKITQSLMGDESKLNVQEWTKTTQSMHAKEFNSVTWVKSQEIMIE